MLLVFLQSMCDEVVRLLRPTYERFLQTKAFADIQAEYVEEQLTRAIKRGQQSAVGVTGSLGANKSDMLRASTTTHVEAYAASPSPTRKNGSVRSGEGVLSRLLPTGSQSTAGSQ